MHGLTLQHYTNKAPLEETYKVIAYADYVQPTITSMEEFDTVINGCSLLERVSGVKLYRDKASGSQVFSCREMDWDYVGVELKVKYMNTRCENGDILVQMVKNVINTWRGSKFMDLTERAHAINCYAISKIWYRCGFINLREGDVSLILSLVKAWLYHDMCVKPSELALFRPTDRGGLGLMHINTRAQAILIRSFLETAVNPMY